GEFPENASSAHHLPFRWSAGLRRRQSMPAAGLLRRSCRWRDWLQSASPDEIAFLRPALDCLSGTTQKASSWLLLCLSLLQNQRYRGGQSFPLSQLPFKLLCSCLAQRVVTGATIVFLGAPFSGNPSPLLQARQSRVE